MPLIPPQSSSPRVYEEWATTAPSDMDYLDMAYEYLDSVNDDYIAWKMSKGYRDAAYEEPDEYAFRARRLAQAWKDSGWTRRDVNNFLTLGPERQREMARQLAIGRQRRGGGENDLETYEAALFYHA